MYQSDIVINTCLSQLQSWKWQIPAAELVHYSINHPSGLISRQIFKGAFHWLASGSLQDVTSQHESLMGAIVFSALARLLAAIDVHCRIVATEPTPVDHEPDCSDHQVCYDDWYSAWWNGVGQFLLDGRNPLPFQEVIQKFENWGCGRMSESCKAKTMIWVRSGDACSCNWVDPRDLQEGLKFFDKRVSSLLIHVPSNCIRRLDTSHQACNWHMTQIYIVVTYIATISPITTEPFSML